jgi:hypothetical protein
MDNEINKNIMNMMGVIHNGDNTQTQDHAITLPNFSPINTNAKRLKNPIFIITSLYKIC